MTSYQLEWIEKIAFINAIEAYMAHTGCSEREALMVYLAEPHFYSRARNHLDILDKLAAELEVRKLTGGARQ